MVTISINEQGKVILAELLKMIHQKNGYHSLKHALTGYLSLSNYFNNKTESYFAFKRMLKPKIYKISPYYYEGNIKKLSENSFKNPLFRD